MTIADLARRAAKLATDNSPNILTALAAAGTVTTAVLAGKASFQAADLIRLKEASDDERGVVLGTPQEVTKARVELVWRLYIPPVVMGAATLACVIGANRVSASRAAGIATAYGLLEKNYSDHKAAITERLGERKADAVGQEVAQARVTETYHDDITMSGLKSGEVCYDMFGGQYFLTTVEDIRSAVNSLNATIIHNEFATLADFYRLLEMEVPTFAESIGWNADNLVEVRIDTTLIHEVKPCLTMTFRKDPLPDYGRFR